MIQGCALATPSRLLGHSASHQHIFFGYELLSKSGVKSFHAVSSLQSANSRSTLDNTKSSDTAYAQRKILDQLRGQTGSASSSLSHADPKPRFNATAEAALNATAGGRGGGIPLGAIDLSGGGGSGSSNGTIDKLTGHGKKWKDLSGGQKVARATVQSSRSVFIFGGAAFTFVLVYALSTELFAKNSPTVIFNDVCKQVQKSPTIAEHLLPPYRFHTSASFGTSASSSPWNPPATGRRSRSVASFTYKDEKTKKEVMLLRFFVQARDKDKDLTLWDTARQEIVDSSIWIGHKLSEGGEWLGEQLGLIDENGNSLFDQATTQQDATHQPSSSSPSSSSSAQATQESSSMLGTAFSRAWNFGFGSLSSLARGSTGAFGKLTTGKREPGTWSSGEVHAEMEKDESGVFQYKTLFVDIPSSAATVRERVWVVRKPDEVKR